MGEGSPSSDKETAEKGEVSVISIIGVMVLVGAENLTEAEVG